MTDTSSCTVSIHRVQLGRLLDGSVKDHVAVEEPLEIKIAHGPTNDRTEPSISLTMRTPGNDLELAAGFLFTEGIVRSAQDVERISPIGLDWIPGETSNAVRVELKPGISIEIARLERHFYTSSSCGVCGKTSIEAVKIATDEDWIVSDIQVPVDVIHGLPERLRSEQSVFDRTGGLHAAALFSIDGSLLSSREDVGRHNALDKLIGAEMIADRLPASDKVLLVSGRASFELVQKAVMAGIPVMAAVGAPSSLAVETAQEFGMTLVGFVRQERFNIYTYPERIRFRERN